MQMIEYEIKISEQATKDMVEIYEHISVSISMPQIALEQFNRIAESIETLRQFPERIKAIQDSKQPTKQFRQLLVNNYSVIFIISGRTVNVVRVAYSPSNIVAKLENS